MAVTIKDIALRVGLSHQAVSFALRGIPKISPKTRERVLAAARDLGYRPNHSALSMRRGSFQNVGLLLSSEMKNSFLPPQLLCGIQDALEKQDVQLTVGRLPDAMLTQEGYIPALLRHWSADGLLINYQEGIPQRMIELMAAETLPAVWLNSRQHGSCVYIDEFATGRFAAETLLAAGHRVIGYADYSHGSDEWDRIHYSGRDRFEGVAQTVRQAGATFVDLRTPDKTLGRDRIHYSQQWLARPDRPSGVATYSSTTANPILVAAVVNGLNVPGDLSIISIDDTVNSNVGPRLTTVILPDHQMGHAAASLLLRRLEDRTLADQIGVATQELTPGETLGPPATR